MGAFTLILAAPDMSDTPVMIQTIADALANKGYDTLTPVQIAVSAPELVESDLLVSAQTGSGKTVGFGLAIAPTILGDKSRFIHAEAPLALVIAPTRELALQVKREFEWLFGPAGAVVASCVGGMDMRTERRTLERGAHIVVATPGRLRDHIMRKSLDMTALRAVVLDEADEMLDLGFREDLEFILGEAPADRRTLMFSATVPKGIASLAKNFQKPDTVRVSTTEEKSQHSDIQYRALNVASGDPENAIINVLRYYEAPNALVFCNTRAMVNRLTSRFSNRGFSVVALSGELSQNERTHALQAMRDGRARVCIATDVAARGIDLPNLELVIHAELPTNSETLLHRSGRTGRAGRKGVSALIVPARARNKAERLLRFAKLTAEWAAAPSAEEVLARDEERLLGDPVWSQTITADEQEFVTKLTALHAPDQIAAAYLRLYQTRMTAPEELAPAGSVEKRAPREAFGPSTWFSISLGRGQGAEPRWLLPMLCRAGNISKDVIGAIRVQESESFVEIAQRGVDGFLSSVGPDMALEEGAVLRQLDSPPAMEGPRPGGKPRRQDGAGPRAPRAPRDSKPPRAPREPRPKPTYTHDNPHPAEAAAEVAEARVKPKYPKQKPAYAKPADSAPRPKRSYDDKPKPPYTPKPASGDFADKPSRKGKPKGDYAAKPKGAGRPKAAYEGKPKGSYEGKPKPAGEGKPSAKYDAKPKPDHTGALKTFKKGASNASVRLGPDGKPLKFQGDKPKGKGTPKEGFSRPVKTRASKGGAAMPRRKPSGTKPKG